MQMPGKYQEQNDAIPLPRGILTCLITRARPVLWLLTYCGNRMHIIVKIFDCFKIPPLPCKSIVLNDKKVSTNNVYSLRISI